IRPSGDHPVITSAHEAGHFLDHHGIGGAGEFATEAAVRGRPPVAELADWLDAVNASDAIRTLRGMGANPNERYRRYLLDVREIWARSYSQYVAVRSNNQRMLGELARLVQRPVTGGTYYPAQWDADDFKPIADAFDRL